MAKFNEIEVITAKPQFEVDYQNEVKRQIDILYDTILCNPPALLIWTIEKPLGFRLNTLTTMLDLYEKEEDFKKCTKIKFIIDNTC